MKSRRDERFFSSTRGKVVTLMRNGDKTVDELAGQLGLTDNAIRGHLAGLERDGLVRQGEPRRGGSKPAFTFGLTDDAERLFPKAYGLLLSQLLGVLVDRIPAMDLANILREVGERVPTGPAPDNDDLRPRIEWAMTLLAELGGVAELQEIEGGYAICGCNCPLSAAVEATPSACLMAESFLTEAVGKQVTQVCDPGPPARCRFEISANGA